MMNRDNYGDTACREFDEFDLRDADYCRDPVSRWAAMRDRCPVAVTTRHGGGWMLSRYEDIAAVALDPAAFSSRVGEVTGPIPEPGGQLRLPPVNSDPPEHGWQRKLLMPYFSKDAVAALEPVARECARSLVDSIIATDGPIDAIADFARVIPVVTTAAMLGLPEHDHIRFRDWTVQMLGDGATDHHLRAAAVAQIRQYFVTSLADSSALGSHGLLARLREQRVQFPQLTDEVIVGMAFLLLIAGIDTTWSALGAGLWHFANHPEDRTRVAQDPSLIDFAVEELLRVYAPVTIGREVLADCEIAGRTVPAGARLVIPWGAANTDPSVHANGSRVCIDHTRSRHFAFGLGIHRCLGAGIARMELRVGLEEWFARIPGFSPVAGEVGWTAGNTRGPSTLPLTIERGGDQCKTP